MLFRVAHAVASSAGRAGTPGAPGTLNMRRSLLDAAAPAPAAAAEAGDARQECPSPDTVRQYGRFLPTLADEYEAVFQADASGAAPPACCQDE